MEFTWSRCPPAKESPLFILAAAEWPSPPCEWTAQAIIAAYLEVSGTGGCNDSKKHQEDDGEKSSGDTKRRKTQAAGEDNITKGGTFTEEDVVDPMNPRVRGGTGAPRSCTWKGSMTVEVYHHRDVGGGVTGYTRKGEAGVLCVRGQEVGNPQSWRRERA